MNAVCTADADEKQPSQKLAAALLVLPDASLSVTDIVAIESQSSICRRLSDMELSAHKQISGTVASEAWFADKYTHPEL